MSLSYFEALCSEPDIRFKLVRVVGTGASSPTIVAGATGAGAGVTCVRQSTGVLRFTWSENPGNFLGLLASGFQATTPTDVDGWTAVAAVYNTTSFYVDVYTYNEVSNTLADLAALNWLLLTFAFRASGVRG